MIRKVFFVFGWSMCLAHSIPGYGQFPGSSSVWGYFSPPLIHRVPSQTHQTPMEAMVDLTNNLAVAILQDHSYSRGNFAFSPYGVASVLVVLYEGARGESARQIHSAVGFPPDKDTVRVGFRDIHRHLRSYFSHEGYLSGISLNKDHSSLKPEYKKVLRFYGYDIGPSSEEDDVGVENSITESSSSQPSTTSTATTPTTKTSTESTTVSSTPLAEEPKTNVTKPGSQVANTTIQSSAIENVTQPMESSYSTEEPEKNVPTASTTISTSTEGTTEPVSLPQPEQTESTTSSTTTTAAPEEMTKPSTAPTTSSLEPERTESTTGASETPEVEKSTERSTEHPDNEDEVEINLTLEENSTPKNDTLENTNNQEEKKEEGSKTEEEKAVGEEYQKKNETSEMESDVSEKSVVTEETTTSVAAEFNSSTDSTAPDSENQTTVTEETKTDFDNGMLIPQAGDNETTPGEESTTTTTTTTTAAAATTTNTTTTTTTNTTTTTTTATTGADQTTPPTTETTPTSPDATTKHGRQRKSESSHIYTKNNINMCQDDGGMSKRIRGIINSKTPKWLHSTTKKTTARIKRTVTDYLKSPHTADLSLQLQNGMYDTHVSRNAEMYRSLPRLLFLVDGAVDTPVPMMTHTSIFPFAYIPQLHAKAMEFPLDDVRYKLLLLLPVERRGLRQLIYDLAEFPLNDVLSAMQPTKIKATIPTFMVEGFVILTSSLQKLGIRDVFDPRKANLSGMSLDPELYVRNVEQSVTVVIRNYVEILDIQTRTMAARQMENVFEASHPFVYFVMDTATNVALMAGQILDPLNSRIY